jgi:aspartyl-tRNA synthetase
MNQRAEDLMMQAPAPVDDARMQELWLKPDLPIE